MHKGLDIFAITRDYVNTDRDITKHLLEDNGDTLEGEDNCVQGQND